MERDITGLTKRIYPTIVSKLWRFSNGLLIFLADEFFKYNDETVTAVPASEVLEDRTGSDANPALLCYVRRDRHLVDTLHREILELNLLGEEEEEEIEVEEKEKAEKVDETTIAPTVEKEAMTVD